MDTPHIQRHAQDTNTRRLGRFSHCNTLTLSCTKHVPSQEWNPPIGFFNRLGHEMFGLFQSIGNHLVNDNAGNPHIVVLTQDSIQFQL